MNQSELQTFTKPHLNIAGKEVLLFSNVRNEAERLPYFFSYYRRLGVNRFFVVDNNSTDDTATIIKAQPDAHYFFTNERFADAAGRNWIEELAKHYGIGHWCIVADADELFVFPGVEFLSIQDLIEYLERHGYQGAYGLFLDMYHPGILTEAKYVPDSPFLNTCSHFDSDSYWLNIAPFFPRVDICGGPRWRKFWSPEDHGVGPTMRKHVLVKWQPGFSYRYNTHSMHPIRLADFTTAVLHFKFFSSFAELASKEHDRADRFRMDHYKVYQEALNNKDMLDFQYSGSDEYLNFTSLVKAGFISASDRFLKFLNQKASNNVLNRYQTAITSGLALELPASPSAFVSELAVAMKDARERNRISLNQFSNLWTILEAASGAAQNSKTVSQSASSKEIIATEQKHTPAPPRKPGDAQHNRVEQSAKDNQHLKSHGVIFDLTVCITAHSETVAAGPTMCSAEAAIQAAEVEGVRVERIIGFDTPTEDCRRYFSQPAFEAWKTAEFEFCDQGRTRNALAEMANGRWLAFLDGDDLFSENWLIEATRRLRQADEKSERVIVHPELNMGFDADQFLLAKTAQDDNLFSPYYYYAANYYDALCAAPREAWLEIPYAHRAVADGFAYEDWQWSIETMAAGWRHVIARNTIIFKRRRSASQTIDAKRNSASIRAVEPMIIDKVGMLSSKSSKKTTAKT